MSPWDSSHILAGTPPPRSKSKHKKVYNPIPVGVQGRKLAHTLLQSQITLGWNYQRSPSTSNLSPSARLEPTRSTSAGLWHETSRCLTSFAGCPPWLYQHHKRRACTGKPGARLKSIESELMDDTMRVLTHVSAESVTCGVIVAKFGVLGFLWNDCISGLPVLPTVCRTSCHAPLPGPTAGWRFGRWVRFTKEGAPEAAD